MKGSLKFNMACVAIVMLIAACSRSQSVDPTKTASKRPNVLVILADDLGYSDISAFGSEISTPNLDQLAKEGRVLTNMHVTPLCATSRASLLTGVDHHLVGVGTLSEDGPLLYPGNSDYAGVINANAPTVAQLLHDVGYHTYMVGKWHLTSLPNDFGFEQSFSMEFKSGSGSNYVSSPSQKEVQELAHYENGKVATVPQDFYSSDYYTNKLISYIGNDHSDGKPFFGYLAFQAVHYPIQVPDAYLNLYKGRYDAGYEALRTQRIQRQKDLGIIPQDFVPHPPAEVPMLRYGQPGVLNNLPWEQLSSSDQQSEARIMEVFAGMLTNMDDNIGRVLNYLKQIGEYDNTFIVFLADNGADGIGVTVPLVDDAADAEANANNSLGNYGKHGSFIYRSSRWAEVGSAPFRLFKGHAAEGGISSPTIVRLPHETQPSTVNAAFASLLDFVPTILDLAGAVKPGPQYAGHNIDPLEGTSLLTAFQGRVAAPHSDDEVFVDEVDDIRFVRQGRWKMTRNVNYAVPSTGYFLTQDWQLYDINADRGETNDVAALHPEIVTTLRAYWRDYVSRVGVKQPAFPPTTIQIND